jgi:hypothetical protein
VYILYLVGSYLVLDTAVLYRESYYSISILKKEAVGVSWRVDSWMMGRKEGKRKKKGGGNGRKKEKSGGRKKYLHMCAVPWILRCRYRIVL